MRTEVLIDERRIQSIDRKIVNYLAAIAGKHPRRFCAPRVENIRFCAAWAMSDEFIRERLAHLVAVGRIDRATDELDGETAEGFRVLPNRLFARKDDATDAGILHLTPLDIRFLAEAGIAVPCDAVILGESHSCA